jgi:mannose-6-phosphate isomerase-like protein (cupin superfamily)
MMAINRRQTTQFQIFERGGGAAVSYDLSQPHRVTITVPNKSTWTSGPHWHETHDEYLQVLQGRALVSLENQVQEFGPEDGIIEVPKYTVHEWRRAPEIDLQQSLVVREWTVPEDGQKEGFFRMLNSFLTEPQAALLYQPPIAMPEWAERWIERWTVTLQLFIIFRSWDNWPVLYGSDNGWVSWIATHVTFWVASWVGFVFGLHGVYDEYIDNGALVRGRDSNGEDKKTPP